MPPELSSQPSNAPASVMLRPLPLSSKCSACSRVSIHLRKPSSSSMTMALIGLTVALLVFVLSPVLVTGHILKCYTCSNIYNNESFVAQAMKREDLDPCWDPEARGIVPEDCHHGHSCYKQQVILYESSRGSSNLVEKFRMVSRYCGSSGFKNGCNKLLGANADTITCACTGDKCNTAAHSVTATSGLIGMMLLFRHLA